MQWPHGKKGDVRWRIKLLQTPQELNLIDKTRNQLRVTEGGEPLDPPSPLRQFVEGGLRPTAPIEYRVHLLHDRTQRLELGSPTADAPQGLPFGFVEATLDAQMA